MAKGTRQDDQISTARIGALMKLKDDGGVRVKGMGIADYLPKI